MAISEDWEELIIPAKVYLAVPGLMEVKEVAVGGGGSEAGSGGKGANGRVIVWEYK